LTLLELPVIDIAIGVFKRSLAVIVIIKELTHVLSAVSEFIGADPVVAVILQLAHIVVAVVIIQSGYARWGIHGRAPKVKRHHTNPWKDRAVRSFEVARCCGLVAVQRILRPEAVKY